MENLLRLKELELERMRSRLERSRANAKLELVRLRAIRPLGYTKAICLSEWPQWLQRGLAPQPGDFVESVVPILSEETCAESNVPGGTLLVTPEVVPVPMAQSEHEVGVTVPTVFASSDVNWSDEKLVSYYDEVDLSESFLVDLDGGGTNGAVVGGADVVSVETQQASTPCETEVSLSGPSPQSSQTQAFCCPVSVCLHLSAVPPQTHEEEPQRPILPVNPHAEEWTDPPSSQSAKHQQICQRSEARRRHLTQTFPLSVVSNVTSVYLGYIG